VRVLRVTKAVTYCSLTQRIDMGNGQRPYPTGPAHAAAQSGNKQALQTTRVVGCWPVSDNSCGWKKIPDSKSSKSDASSFM
jgi:hypothetical protein